MSCIICSPSHFFHFFGIRKKWIYVLLVGKRLPSLMDTHYTRGITSALPAFWVWRGEWPSSIFTHSCAKHNAVLIGFLWDRGRVGPFMPNTNFLILRYPWTEVVILCIHNIISHNSEKSTISRINTYLPY